MSYTCPTDNAKVLAFNMKVFHKSLYLIKHRINIEYKRDEATQ